MDKYKDVLPGILVALVVIAGAFLFWQKQDGFFGSRMFDEGNKTKEQRNVSEFTKISLAGHGTIILKQSDEVSLEVEAGEKLMEYILTDVVGDELKISYKETPSGLINFTVNYYITVKDLEKLEILGSGKVESSTISSDEIQLTIDGSGSVSMNLEVQKLLASIEGSGKYNLKGQANEQTVKISGSGKYLGKELEGTDGKVDIEGSGKVEINTTQTLDVSIDGSGSVYYLGDPNMSSVNISGSGKVEKL